MTKPIKRFRTSTNIQLTPGDLIFVWDGWNPKHKEPRSYLIFEHQKPNRMMYLNFSTGDAYPGSDKLSLQPTLLLLKEDNVVVTLNPSPPVLDYLKALGL